ncbi:MAG TPA: HDOD domain-containing protein [Steroidobacteraceae bacterium]|nr:HDOD domain-containing protein [Steroidobacteraceae bacterium]
MTTLSVQTFSPQTPSHDAFAFIRSLAGELSGGKVELPSFPEIAVRVRRILSDPKSSVDQVVRVVGSEPALTARLLRIANSASLNRSGKTVTDLRTAINRIGYNMVRSASISFAMAQIRNSNKLAGLEDQLQTLWKSSTVVAAFAFVLARTCTRVNPDEAMLTGMMHGIGKLYVLTRATAHPEFFTSDGMLDQIINEWHPSIGKAILENWEFPEDMAQAVGDQQELGRTEPERPDLSDVIAVAVLMERHYDDAAGLEAALDGLPASARLGLNEARTMSVMRDSAVEVKALSEALGA